MRTQTYRFTIILLALTLVASALADTNLGQPLAIGETTPITQILSDPDAYVDQSVQVKGEVTEVCEKAGCWMKLVDRASGKAIRIKVRDGEIVFPPEAIGKTAIAEGKFQKIELTKEQAVAQQKHEAEENGRPFDPKSVSGPVTLYQIRGAGAVVLD